MSRANPLLASWEILRRSDPEKPALVHPDGNPISRREVDDASLEYAEKLRKLGHLPSRILAMKLENGLPWMAVFLATQRLSLVCIPIDSGLGEERFLAMAHRLKAAAIWTPAGLSAVVSTSSRRFRDPELALGKCTSGTQGEPQVYFFSAAQMRADGENIVQTMGIRAGDVNLGLIPWGHSYGLGNIVIPMLIQGTPTTWTPTPLPHAIAEVARATQASVFPAVPTLLRAIVRTDLDSSLLASLRLVVSAGARLDPGLCQAFRDRFGLVPRNFYGSSETGGISYDGDGEASLTGRSVGQPLRNVLIETNRLGRVVVSSGAVHTYANHRRADNGWGRWPVADCGRIDSSGELLLEGRAKGIVKVGGKRIDLAEVERCLMAIPNVTDAYARGLQRDGETLLGAAVETDLPRLELARIVREALPRAVRPKRILTKTSFPITSRAKTDTAALAAELDALAQIPQFRGAVVDG